MRISVEIPTELHRRVRNRVFEEDSTISRVVRRLLEDYVADHEVAVIIDRQQVAVVKGALAPMTIKGDVAASRVTVDAVSKTTVKRSNAKRPLPDFSKEAQVKGKMRR